MIEATKVKDQAEANAAIAIAQAESQARIAIERWVLDVSVNLIG